MAALPLPLAETRADASRRRGYWLRTLYRWHWLSSAACLIALLLFAATGFTLNHASSIEARPKVAHRSATLPGPLLDRLRAAPTARGPLPTDVAAWLASTIDVRTGSHDVERSPQEVYVALPGPGVDAGVTIALDDGAVDYESTDRGWIAYFNDLHKGRNTGPAWSWFIDVFAISCLLFASTGLCLLWLHGRSRPSTWPMVGLGLVLPLVVLLLFVH